MLKKSAVLAAVFAATLALGGCFGGDTEVKQTTVSKGQELSDLKKALDSGAISQKEYDRMHKEIVDRRY